MKTRSFRELINREASRVGLPLWRGLEPGCWLEGLVLAESGGRPEAIRYEAHQDRAGRRDAASDGDVAGRDDGLLEDDKSYGLMQVMGYNIRRLCGFHPGCPIRFAFAFEPETNTDRGATVDARAAPPIRGRRRYSPCTEIRRRNSTPYRPTPTPCAASRL